MLLSFLLLAGALWLVAELGWFSPCRPWAQATGWDRVPADERAPRSTRYRDGGPEIFWLGHAGIALRWAGGTILLDPNTGGHCTVARRAMEMPDDLNALGRIDAAVISHAHFDHMSLETLRRVKQLDRIVVPSGSEVYIDGPLSAASRVVPLDAHGAVRVGGLEIVAVPAAHNGNRYHPWQSPRRAAGYIIRDGRDCVYFAGDTSAANDFAAIRERYHPDFAILPIGAFSPRRPLKLHHMNPAEAVQAAQTLGVAAMMPCHFGTYRLTFDRVDTALPLFARAARAAGLRWIMPVLWKDAHEG